mgnify:CR=1 FL=1
MTRQRKLLKKILESSDKHLSAEELYAMAKKQMPEIAMATVYRNLKLMVDAGEIRRVKMYQGADFYDKSTKPHDHAVCKICGEICDLNSSDRIKNVLEEEFQLKISSYDLNIYYICPKCQTKQKNHENFLNLRKDPFIKVHINFFKKLPCILWSFHQKLLTVISSRNIIKLY